MQWNTWKSTSLKTREKIGSISRQKSITYIHIIIFIYKLTTDSHKQANVQAVMWVLHFFIFPFYCVIDSQHQNQICIASFNNSKKCIFSLFLQIMIKFYRRCCSWIIIIPNNTYENNNETQSIADIFYWELDWVMPIWVCQPDSNTRSCPL